MFIFQNTLYRQRTSENALIIGMVLFVVIHPYPFVEGILEKILINVKALNYLNHIVVYRNFHFLVF